MAAAAEVYRRLLKAVQKHVGRGATKQRFLDFGAAEFRAPAGTEAGARARLRLAGDYAYLLTSVHHHKVLEIVPMLSMYALSHEGGNVFDEMPRRGRVT